MNKILYEYYYVVGHRDFESYYILRVDRETEKMYYGEVFSPNKTATKGNRFSIKKENLDSVYEITNTNHGLVYRVQVDAEDEYAAKAKAKQIVYDYIINVVEGFKNYEGD